MRWGYLIPRFILVALLWGFMAFGFDPLVRYSAIQAVQSITGAKADIDSLETAFFPPTARVHHVALASADRPGTNLVEFDDLTFRVAGDALLRRCYVVEEARLTGVRFGTPRSDDGQLPWEPESEEESGPMVPPWLQDKLKNIGHEWLEEFTQQAKAQIDPNRLETYRVGNEVYAKWDGRFREIQTTIETKKAQLEELQRQIRTAKEGEPIDRVQKYLTAAQNADILIRDSRTFLTQLQASVPQEVKQDFARLDQAQKNDRENIEESIRMLKPDARRITESLLGEEMYLQLDKLLSWAELARSYVSAVKAPPEPERGRGTDFEFPILNPTPRMLFRKMLLDGELLVGNVPTPFRGILTDVSSDPKLHGRPSLLQATTGGQTPVEFLMRHDATTEVAVTDLAARFTDLTEHALAAGRENGDRLTASLQNLKWNAEITMQEGQVTGQIDVSSDFGQPVFQTTSPYATALAGLTQDTLQSIKTVNATVRINGPALHPHVEMTSDLGQKLVAGFETAFAANLPQMKQQAIAMVSAYANERRQDLSAKLGGRYGELLGDHEKLMKSLDDARTLAMNLRSGHVDPNEVYRTVSQTGLLSEKDQQKADKYMGTVNQVLGGAKDPDAAIQQALPVLKKKLFR
ncbi:MAG: TIGR03545 family protein [Planctomycetaceae bacterium]